MRSPVDPQTGEIDYDAAIQLDAEDLAEAGLRASYEQDIAPALIELGVRPASVRESLDEVSGRYAVEAQGRNIQLAMTVKDAGPNPAPGLTVSVDLSDSRDAQVAGLVITDKGAGVGKGVQIMTRGSAVWQPGDLSPGSSASARLTLHGASNGTAEVTVVAVSDAGEPTCSRNGRCSSTRVTHIRVREWPSLMSHCDRAAPCRRRYGARASSTSYRPSCEPRSAGRSAG